MSQPQNFPVELLQGITRYLPRSTIYQCISVCKSWSTAAIISFYEELIFEKKDIDMLRAIMNNKVRNHPLLSYGNLVKKLAVKGDKNNLPQKEVYINDVLRLFPGLRTIDLSSYPNLGKYCDKGILGNMRVANLGNIREIIVHKYPEVPVDADDMENGNVAMNYIKICNKYHDSITHLTFSYYFIDLWVDSIKHYHQLTHLSIHNNLACRYPISKEESFTSIFLCQCPELISFTLLNSFSLPDDYDEFPYFTRSLCSTIESKEKWGPPPLLDIDPVIPPLSINKKLKKIFLAFPSITTENGIYYILYPIIST